MHQISEKVWQDKFKEALARSKCCHPIVVMEVLVDSLDADDSSTMQELTERLHKVREVLTDSEFASISTTSSGEMFTRYLTRASAALEDAKTLKEARSILVQRGREFIESCKKRPYEVASRALVLFRRPIHKLQLTILTHSSNLCCKLIFLEAKQRGFDFKLYVTEGRPDNKGQEMVQELQTAGINCTLIPDTSMQFYVEECDFVLMGAEAIIACGGVIGQIGSATMAAVAQTHKKPVYAVGESYRLTEEYFLLDSQSLCAKYKRLVMPGDCPKFDFTKATRIEQLVTDIGLLYPVAVLDTVNHIFF